MSWLDDWGVPKIEMVTTKRHCNCRGKNCRHIFNIGDKALRIYMPSTRGNYPSFFCKKCIPKLFEQMEKAMDDALVIFHEEGEETKLMDFLTRRHK